jgi:arginine deiminase
MGIINVSSEVGQLKKVVLHKPGHEVEVVTPANAEELLYNDIIDLKDAVEQHDELSGVLSKVCTTYEVKKLLSDILEKKSIKTELIDNLVNLSNCPEVKEELIDLPTDILSQKLLSGTHKKINTLTKYLSKDEYALPPIPNLFFTRDSTMVVNNKIVIGSMANKVRIAESVIMKHIYAYHPEMTNEGFLFDATQQEYPELFTIEGGDLHILREDTIAIGMSERTSPYAIDYIAKQLNKYSKVKNIFVVILPKHKAYIHLDMVFSMIDKDKCVVYPPLILGKERHEVIYMKYNDDDEIDYIKPVNNLLDGLKSVGLLLEPILCGGQKRKDQDREQWQSGANFFAIGPGKIIGYERNEETLTELEKAGIPIVRSKDVLENRVELNKMDKYAVTINSSELTRGGGGCRCMTQPILRGKVF